MAKFVIEIPEGFKDELIEKVIKVAGKQAIKELPEYPQFVQALMKTMESAGDELMHAAVGMSGETGELLDTAKKTWVYNKPLDVENIVEELGDLRFYYQAMLNLFQLTEEEVIAYNMLKLEKRYPKGSYSDTDAQARADKLEPLSAEGKKGKEQPEARKFFNAPNPVEIKS